MEYRDAEEYLDFGSILERDSPRKCHTKLDSHGEQSLNAEPECPNDQTKQNLKKWEDLSMILSGAYFDGSDTELGTPYLQFWAVHSILCLS